MIDLPLAALLAAALALVAFLLGRRSARRALRESEARYQSLLEQASAAGEVAEHQRAEMVRADKVTALGTLVSGVAHEVNNPNHFIMLNLPVLQEIWKDAEPILAEHHRTDPDLRLGNMTWDDVREDVPRLLSEVQKGAERIRDVVTNLRDFARGQSDEELVPLDLNDVVRSALTLLASPIRKSTRRFSVEYGEDLPPVEGRRHQLEQLVINVALNACQSLPTPDRGIAVQTGRSDDLDAVYVEIADEGCGIEAAELARITDPFYTTRREDGGSGLGLAVAVRIADDHGGRLSYHSKVGRGTTARLELPALRVS